MRLISGLLPFLLVLLIAANAWAADTEDSGPASGETHNADLGTVLPLWSAIPFAGILLSIALFPLLAPHFWHHHFPKVSAFWSLVFAVPFLVFFKMEALHSLYHIMIVDFVPFLILISGLYIVAGGISVKGSLSGSPAVNAVLIFIGCLLASWIGTTGAAMVMIRPILRANAWRKYRAHTVVFFIFLVANISGSLTPLGDPPLFLGFLHGVTFFWTMRHVLPDTLFTVGIVLAIYLFLDLLLYRKEPKKPVTEVHEPIRVEGLINLLYLAGIVLAVLGSGLVNFGEINLGLGIRESGQNLLRDFFILCMAVLSYQTTNMELRKANEFGWGPIKEVAILFAGIFITIVPALAILRAGTQGALAFLIEAVNSPTRFFWATGILSSFLDNAPTYLTFFNAAIGQLYPGMAEPVAVPLLMGQTLQTGLPNGADFLVAISAGAVFMGANTYIGNAPNFMVKAIAEESGVPMPSFFGYMFKYSIPVLIPVFILVTWLFI